MVRKRFVGLANQRIIHQAYMADYEKHVGDVRCIDDREDGFLAKREGFSETEELFWSNQRNTGEKNHED